MKHTLTNAFVLILLLMTVVSSFGSRPIAVIDDQNSQTQSEHSNIAQIVIPSILDLNSQVSHSKPAGPILSNSEYSDQLLPLVNHSRGRSLQEIEQDLYQASLGYIGETPEAANQIAKKIAFNWGRYETVRNVCGPLSIAILKSAGLLSSSTSMHNIWLLCPRGAEHCDDISVLYKEYFPPDDYDYLKTTKNVRDYDFISNPLKPGDWMYLFVERNGFDHMLTVTRVDKEGRAYTVTNLRRKEGWAIKEELLYDPNQPGNGIFYEFSDVEERDYLGVTGDAGFLLVRRKNGLTSIPILNQKLDQVLDTRASWNGIVKEVGSTSLLYESLSYQKFHPASLIKIPLAMVVLKNLENKGVTALDLKSGKDGNQYFDKLLTDMVVASDEYATNALLDYTKGQKVTRSILESWGFTETYFDLRSTTARELAALLEQLYTGKLLNPEMRDYLLELMSSYTENDSTYLGIMTSAIEGSVYYNKRGTTLKPLIVGDMGILKIDDHAYVIVLCGRSIDQIGTTYDSMVESIENFGKLLSDEIRE